MMRTIVLLVALAALGACGVISPIEGKMVDPRGEVAEGALKIEPLRVTFADGTVFETATDESGPMAVATARMALDTDEEEEALPVQPSLPSATMHYEMRRVLRQNTKGRGLCGPHAAPTHLMIMRNEQEGWTAVTALRRRMLTWDRCQFHVSRDER